MLQLANWTLQLLDTKHSSRHCYANFWYSLWTTPHLLTPDIFDTIIRRFQMEWTCSAQVGEFFIFIYTQIIKIYIYIIYKSWKELLLPISQKFMC